VAVEALRRPAISRGAVRRMKPPWEELENEWR